MSQGGLEHTPAPLFWVKNKMNAEKRKAGRESKPPPPPPLSNSFTHLLLIWSFIRRYDRYKNVYQFQINCHNPQSLQNIKCPRGPGSKPMLTDIFLLETYCFCEMVYIRSEWSLRSLEWNWGLPSAVVVATIAVEFFPYDLQRSRDLFSSFQVIIWKTTFTLSIQFLLLSYITHDYDKINKWNKSQIRSTVKIDLPTNPQNDLQMLDSA